MMKIEVTCCVCCLIFLCASCTAPVVEDYWIYRNLSPGENGAEIIIDSGNKKLTVGDLVVTLNFCRDTDEFLCFGSEFLSFAVPRNLSEKSAPWNYGGVEYRIIRRRDELILGQELSIFTIEAKREGNNLAFYFSNQRGLIALSGMKPIGTPLLSVGYCGFGAETDCRVSAH